MPRIREYKEGQSFTANFKFYDESFAPVSPNTVRYRIDCLTTRQVIRDWTILTPAQSINILVVPNDNRIVNGRNPSEKRQLVVQSNYETDNQAVQATDWSIKNLQGVT